MLQTLITAGLWGIFAVVMVLLLAWGAKLVAGELGMELPERADIVAFLAALAGCATFFPVAIHEWPLNRAHWEYIVEVGMGADLNQDGVIGDPNPKAGPKLKLTVNNGLNHPPDRDDVEFDELSFPDLLPEMARQVRSGINFTFANFGAPGRMFSQPQWNLLTEEMRSQGYIQYKNPAVKNLGYDFTEKGQQLLDDLVQQGRRIEREMMPPTHLQQFAVEALPLPQLRKRR